MVDHIPISPDDLEDTTKVMKDLCDWIIDHKEFAPPDRMSFILTFTAAKIAFIHLEEDNVRPLLQKAVDFGIVSARNDERDK